MGNKYGINQRLTPAGDQTSATLIDNSGGTASGTIADITEVSSAGSADRVPTENAIASLAAQVNDLIADVAALKAQNS